MAYTKTMTMAMPPPGARPYSVPCLHSHAPVVPSHTPVKPRRMVTVNKTDQGSNPEIQ
jgi:hypothetical protein